MIVSVDSKRSATPSQQECLDLVRRIACSSEFRRANRLREFLNYVVDRSMAGATHEVTEILIGERVFARPAGYNPSDDSIVRTEARNLRLRLDRYFAGPGAAEPVLLEIPKGAYLPVFHWREPFTAAPELLESPAPLPPAPTRRYWLAACASVAAAAIAGWRFGVAQSAAKRSSSPLPPLVAGRVGIESSDARLVSEFLAAKARALSLVYSGDKIGDWYDGSMGERYSFCARDIAHQSAGAAVLGLAGHTQNMLRRFAVSVSSDRSWRPYWEINKDGFPVSLHGDPGDHFCLPASFDLLQTCYRQFLWRGDEAYLDAAFSQFYDRTMTGYIEAFDPHRSGLLESAPESGPGATPTYWEHQPRVLTGGDLMAAQYAAHLAYARIQRRKGAPGSLSQRLGQDHEGHAQVLKLRYNTEWWNPEWNRHYSAIMPDRSYYNGYLDDANTLALLFHLAEDGPKAQAALDTLERHRPPYDQTYSYFPDILFQYGRPESAYRVWRELATRDPSLPKIPEIAFVSVGSIASGMMGISPNAPESSLETLPRLPTGVEWVKLSSVPVLRNEIAVLHRGGAQTTVTNQNGPLFRWQPAFNVESAGRLPKILLDGSPVESTLERRLNGQTVIVASVALEPGQTRTARLSRDNRAA